LKGVTAALLACICFSLTPVFEKTLLQSLSPLALAAIRSIIAGLLLLLAMESLHKLGELKCLGRRDCVILAWIVLMVGVLGPLTYLTGLKTTAVANGLIILRLNSLLIAFFAWILLGEKMTLHQFLGTTLMITGLVTIFTRGFTISYGFHPGDLYIAAAAVMFSSSSVLMKKYLHHLPPEVLVVVRNLAAGLILLTLAFGDVSSVTFNFETASYLIALAVIGILFVQLLWYYALEHASATNVGLTSISVPVFGSFFAWLFLGETLAGYQILGGFLVILGLVGMEIHLSQLKIMRKLKFRVFFHH